MKPLRIILAAAGAVALHASAFAQDLKGDMEYFMSEYLRAWNAHDAKLIIKDFYRLDPSHRWATVEGLQAEFDRAASRRRVRRDLSRVRAPPRPCGRRLRR